MKKINAKEVKAGEIVATLTTDELGVVRRAYSKIGSSKSVIETLTDGISKQYEVIKNMWRNYDYPDEIDKELAERGLALSLNERTGEIKISKITESELRKALYHNLFW